MFNELLPEINCYTLPDVQAGLNRIKIIGTEIEIRETEQLIAQLSSQNQFGLPHGSRQADEHGRARLMSWAGTSLIALFTHDRFNSKQILINLINIKWKRFEISDAGFARQSSLPIIKVERILKYA
jgi:hypothetical protein